jgi:GH15 family glucan-1,4-alpha-glucosidase
MKIDFRLSQTEADALLSSFRHAADVAEDNGESIAASTWREAARLLHEAQLAAFQARSSRALRLRSKRHETTAPR